ncbi:MAG: hypothetical protein ACRCW2_07275 [Cellulosilyticaceae bacterium]
MYKEGLYEKVITKALSKYLAENDRLVIREPLDQGEADHVLSRHLTEVIQLALKQIEEDKRIKEEDKLTKQVALVNQVIEQLSVSRGEAFDEEQVADEAKLSYF